MSFMLIQYVSDFFRRSHNDSDSDSGVYNHSEMPGPPAAPPKGYRWGPQGIVMAEAEWQRVFGDKRAT